MMYRHCSFSYNRRITQRTVLTAMKYDDERKAPYQPKYDYNLCSNPKIHDSPHLVIAMRSKHLVELNQNNLRRLAL
jgi:hypothetical protein